MCGRYSLVEINKLLLRYSIADSGFHFLPRYNIAPTQEVPIVVHEEKGNKLKSMKWGLVPHWAKDKRIGNSLINARAETIVEKPAFRSSFQKRRCLVPADAFYEWEKVGKQKVPLRILPKEKGIFSIAGIWDRWETPEKKDLLSFSIITTSPNDMMKPIHNRMPVILGLEDEDTWLNPESSKEHLLSLLKPCPEDYLEYYEVSRNLNNPANDRPELIQAV
ncbi:MAG: SOS response-associated peptidase [bacterium]